MDQRRSLLEVAFAFALTALALTACADGEGTPDLAEDAGGVRDDASEPDGDDDSSKPAAPDRSDAGDAGEATPEDDAGAQRCTRHAECDDGLVCNGQERCAEGQCVGGVPEACAPEHACREETRGCDCRNPNVDGDGHDAIDCGGDDCDDSDPRISPSAIEVCDPLGANEDCRAKTYYDESDPRDGDADGDGYVSEGCENFDDDGTRSGGDDCRDDDPRIHPDIEEVCDYADNDCNGVVDEARDVDGNKTGIEDSLREDFFPDFDQDGYGDRSVEAMRLCGFTQPPGYILGAGPEDCDDQNPEVFEHANELCDGIDNDCDELTDAADDDLLEIYNFNDTTVLCEAGAWIIPDGGCPEDRLWCTDIVDQGCTTDARQLTTCRACETDCQFACGELGCDEPVLSAGGDHHHCAVTGEGRVACWGRGADGRLGNDGTRTSHEPVEVQLLSDVRGLSAGGASTCAIEGEARELYCWGSNARRQLANTDAEGSYSPVPLPVLDVYYDLVMSDVVEVDVGIEHACAVLGNGALACWGYAGDGRLANWTSSGDRDVYPSLAVTGTQLVSDARAVTVGEKHGCMITDTDTVRCWGDNSYGQLGDSTFTEALSTTARAVPNLGSVTAISAGLAHTCVLSEGDVLCWGLNSRLQLGRESGPNDGVPTLVEGLGEVTAIGAGLSFTCALDAGGQVLCWGGNEHGERGDESTDARAEPMPVEIDAVVVSIAVGFGHACALTEEQKLYCWGRNPFGQLGNGSSTQGATAIPAQVTALQPE